MNSAGSSLSIPVNLSYSILWAPILTKTACRGNAVSRHIFLLTDLKITTEACSFYGFVDDHSGKMDWENQTTKIRKWQSFETCIRPIIQNLWVMVFVPLCVGNWDPLWYWALSLPTPPPPLQCALSFYSLKPGLHSAIRLLLTPVFTSFPSSLCSIYGSFLFLFSIFSKKYLFAPMTILQPDDFQL